MDHRQESSRRALVVATEQEDAGLLAFQLKKLGLTTMVVANESDALGALAWGTPDIIVVELGGPELDALHLMVSLGGQRCAAFVIASRPPTADEELTLLRLGVQKLYHRPLDHQAVADRMAHAEPLVLPMDNATTASSIEGELSQFPLETLLNLARRHKLNARLEVRSPGRGQGTLWIRGGQLIQGVRGQIRGREAVVATLAGVEGHFDFHLLDDHDPDLQMDDEIGMDLATLMSLALESHAPNPKTRRPRNRSRPTTIPPGMAKRLNQEEISKLVNAPPPRSTEAQDPSPDGDARTRAAVSPWTEVHRLQALKNLGPETIQSDLPTEMLLDEVLRTPIPTDPSRVDEKTEASDAPPLRENQVIRTDPGERESDKTFDVPESTTDTGLDKSDMDFLSSGTNPDAAPQLGGLENPKTIQQVAPRSDVLANMLGDDANSDVMVFESGTSGGHRAALTPAQEAELAASRPMTPSSGRLSRPLTNRGFSDEDVGETDSLMEVLRTPDDIATSPGIEPKDGDDDESLVPAMGDLEDESTPLTDGPRTRRPIQREVITEPGHDEDTEQEEERPSSRRARIRNMEEDLDILPDFRDIDDAPTREELRSGAQDEETQLVPQAQAMAAMRDEVTEPGPEQGAPRSRSMEAPLSRPLSRPMSRPMGDLDDDLDMAFPNTGAKMFRRGMLAVLLVAALGLGYTFVGKLMSKQKNTSPAASLVGSEEAPGEAEEGAKQDEEGPGTVNQVVTEITGMKDGSVERTYAMAVYALTKRKDAKEASRQFRNVLAEEPNHEGANRGLFTALVKARDFKSALKQIEKLQGTYPDDPGLIFQEALVAQQHRDGARARKAIHRFLKAAPEHTYAPKAREMLAASEVAEEQP